MATSPKVSFLIRLPCFPVSSGCLWPALLGKARSDVRDAVQLVCGSAQLGAWIDGARLEVPKACSELLEKRRRVNENVNVGRTGARNWQRVSLPFQLRLEIMCSLT